MYRLIKTLVILAVIALATSWLVNNNGEVVVNWLGYEIITDVFMVVVLSLILLVLIFILSILVVRVFSFKLSFIKNKILGKKDSKKIEKLEKNIDQSFSALTKVLALLDEGEVRLARKEYKKFCGLIKNKDIIEYLEFRFGYFESDAYDAKKSKKIDNDSPGSSPQNDKSGESYFTFASQKGWKR